MTHNIKNVYNNIEKRTVFVLPPVPPSLSFSLTLPEQCTINLRQPFTADFNHIQDLYMLESDKPVKVAHKLKKACFNPSSIEKTSVKFASAVFHESTHTALIQYSSSQNRSAWVQTAVFLQLFATMWNVVNVKSSNKGQRKRDEAAKPVTSPSDWKLKFLEDFSGYLRMWQQSGQPGLSQETFLALKHTLSTLAALCRYLLTEKSFHYVLLGFMQSDNLEGRFGWYRQLSGANYFISLRQVRESEKKIRIISLLKQSGFTVSDASDGIANQSESWSPDEDIVNDIISRLPPSEPPNMDDCNVIYYIAGYVAQSTSTNKKCESCSNHLKGGHQAMLPTTTETGDIRDLLNHLNRGGLCDPTDSVYNMCVQFWSTFLAIKSCPHLSNMFLRSTNARILFVATMHTVLLHEELILVCDRGHELNTPIIQKFFNCMAKNWVSHLNQDSNNSAKNRKIQKVSK